MRQERSILFAAVVSAMALPQVIRAQTLDFDLRVRLESSDGSRVSGALVALLDSSQRVVREGLSGEDGARVLRAPPGSYRVRVRRIGFLPFISEAVAVPRDGDLVVHVETQRVLLETVVVTSRSQCGAIDPSERILSVVWDEIAKALRTSQLSPRDFAEFTQSFVYRKSLTRNGGVVSSDTIFRPVGNRKPFGVLDPVALAAQGYVLGNERLGWTYYAPDEAVLLSDQFAATHCFQVVRARERSGQVGIEFKPVPRGANADIAGVLWVDERTAELRELIFRFVNAGILERFRAGGFARFRRVPSGGWIVDDWALRAPILVRSRDSFSDLQITGYVEDGGGIVLRKQP